MGKRPPSFLNVTIGTSIAQTACKPTGSKLDLVARSGCCSVFQAVSEIYAPCLRDDVTNRDGISECQFNKALQKAGFQRVRDRRTHVNKRAEDPTGAGMYLFSNMRWRNPNHPDDRIDLVQGYDAIVERFPNLAKECSLARFLDVIARFHKQWESSAESMSAACNFEVETGEESDESARHTPMQISEPVSSPGFFQLTTNEILTLQVALATSRTLELLTTRAQTTIPGVISKAAALSPVPLRCFCADATTFFEPIFPPLDMSLNTMN